MALANSSVHMVKGAPQNGCCQCLCPQGELQLLSASLSSADRSDTGSSQITASALSPGVCDILCAPFKSKISIFPSPLGFLKVSSTLLQSQILWELIFPLQEPQAGEPNMRLRPLTPLEEPLQCNYSPICRLPAQGYGIDYIVSLLLLPISLWFPFYTFSCRRSLFVGLSLFHGCSADSCDFGVHVKEGELRVFLLCHIGQFLS